MKLAVIGGTDSGVSFWNPNLGQTGSATLLTKELVKAGGAGDERAEKMFRKNFVTSEKSAALAKS